MELPSLETTTRLAKWVAGFATSVSLFLIRKKRKKVEDLNYPLRRKEDASLRDLVGLLERRLTIVEKRVDEKNEATKSFLLAEIHNSEERVTSSINIVGGRIDDHYNQLNSRLDNLLRK